MLCFSLFSLSDRTPQVAIAISPFRAVTTQRATVCQVGRPSICSNKRLATPRFHIKIVLFLFTKHRNRSYVAAIAEVFLELCPQSVSITLSCQY